jgi:glyoxylase-like metal-dependent hydrolase (beta-lactamase superfamily II)
MREIVDGVFEIPITFVHAYLIVTDDGVVLVDTGLPNRSGRIRAALAATRRSIGDVRTILLTHWHADHTGALAELKRDSGAQVVAHRLDAPLIDGSTPPPPPKGFVRVSNRFVGTAAPAGVDVVLDGDGPTSVPGFTAVHTPGHTHGHVSYLLDRGDGILFTGDAAMGRPFQVGHTPKAATADVAAARRSVAKLAGLDFAVAVFGHGPAVRDRAVDRFRALAAR